MSVFNRYCDRQILKLSNDKVGWKSLRVRYEAKVKSRPILFQDGVFKSLNGPLNVIHGSAIDSFPLSILGGELRISTMFRCLVVRRMSFASQMSQFVKTRTRSYLIILFLTLLVRTR